MHILIHPTYFPNVAHFVAMVTSQMVTLETAGTYQKQTYRNRTNIYGANGKLPLSIPIIHSQSERQKYRDIRIHSEEKWQQRHWKSLESAYRTSPFFEFYEDDLRSLFTQPAEFLLEHNLNCLEAICSCLQFELTYNTTVVYEKTITDMVDLRSLALCRKESRFDFERYTQVFDQKHGFIANLSILDLLFHEGPNAINYLKNQFDRL